MKINTCNHRGKLCLRYYIDGKPRYKVVTNPHNVEAEKLALAVELKIGKPTKEVKRKQLPLLPVEGTDNESILGNFLQAVAVGAVGRGHTPEAKHVQQVNQYLRRIFVALKIKAVDDLDADKVKGAIGGFQQIRTRKSTSKRTTKNPHPIKLLSNASKNRYVQIVKQFSEWLCDKRYTDHDKLSGLKSWPRKGYEVHPRTCLSFEELSKVIAAASMSAVTVEGMTGIERARLYMLSAGTGLRRSELARLTPASFVGLGTDQAAVWAKKGQTKNREKALQGLPPVLAALLSAWLPTLPKDALLFPRLAGRKSGKMIRVDLAAAGVDYQAPSGEFRDFHGAGRHTYVTSLWTLPGITAHDAMLLARHKSLDMTLRYSHEAQGQRVRAVQGLVLPALPSP